MKSRVIHQAQGALLGLAALTLAAAPGLGADQGPYFTFEGGVSLPERTDVRIYDWSDKAEFDPGAHLGFVAGYNFNKWFSAEFETGWYYNTLQDVDASITHVPFLVNAVFRYENRSRLVPYVGAGVGGDSTWLTLDYADLDGDGYWDYDGTDATVVFAYQAFAGLRYNFNANASLGLSYRFYATGGPEFDVDNRYYDIKLDDIYTHSFNLVFTLRF